MEGGGKKDRVVEGRREGASNGMWSQIEKGNWRCKGGELDKYL